MRKTEIKVSVIIPVFNGEKYIEKCLQSIINQSLPEIEIIIVNDGSTDRSLSIINQFVESDSRIKLVNQENKGVSAARNKGLEIVNGEWIAFADADDWLEPEMYLNLYNATKIENIDIVMCNANSFSNDKFSSRLTHKNERIDFQTNRQSVLINLMRFKYDYANWNKLYSARIIKEYNIFFSETLNIYEDLLFNLIFWQYCKKGIFKKDHLYNYRIHDESVMKRENSTYTNEYKNLALEFTSLCFVNGWIETLTVFQLEIRRGFYYRHLPLMIKRMRQTNISMVQKVKLLTSQLGQLPPLLFNYNREEMKGVQYAKKVLLKHKQFHLFSIIEMVRN